MPLTLSETITVEERIVGRPMRQLDLEIVAEFFMECTTCCNSSEYEGVPKTISGCLAAGWQDVSETGDEMSTHQGTCPECVSLLAEEERVFKAEPKKRKRKNT